ncbi:hypothetical protein SCALM49S_09451 [Streptomyces californicus]
MRSSLAKGCPATPGGSAHGVRCGASHGGDAPEYWTYSGVSTTRRGAVAVVVRPPGCGTALTGCRAPARGGRPLGHDRTSWRIGAFSMTPTLVRNQPYAGAPAPADAGSRARDWAEIQERMLAPLHEAVYDRMEVGAATRMLALGCGSGLAMLVAAARGAHVTGVDSDRERLALARTRLLPGADGDETPAHSPHPAGGRARLMEDGEPRAVRRGRRPVQPDHGVRADRLRGRGLRGAGTGAAVGRPAGGPGRVGGADRLGSARALRHGGRAARGGAAGGFGAAAAYGAGQVAAHPPGRPGGRGGAGRAAAGRFGAGRS